MTDRCRPQLERPILILGSTIDNRQSTIGNPQSAIPTPSGDRASSRRCRHPHRWSPPVGRRRRRARRPRPTPRSPSGRRRRSRLRRPFPRLPPA